MLPYKIEIVEYLDPDGSSSFGNWFADVDAKAAAKIRTALARMESGNFGDTKSVGSGVLERRIDFGPGYRVYFGKDGDTLVVLLAGGTKQRQQRDIAAAQSLWRAYLGAKKKESKR